MSSSVMQQHGIHGICLILQSDQKIDVNAWCQWVYTMFPRNMDHVMPCSPGT